MATELKLTLEVTGAERLDKILLRKLHEYYPTLSRTALKSCFSAKKVLLHGKSAPPSLELSEGRHQVIVSSWCVESMMVLAAQASPDGCFLPVVYEDEELLVLHKASGVPSVAHSQQETTTAVNAALAHCPEMADVGYAGLEPGILHRLDTETSGLLLFAKNDREFKRLKAAWKTRAVRKFYRAVAQAEAAPSVPRLLDFPLGHDAHSAKRMLALTGKPGSSKIRGKPLESRTWLRAIHSFQAGLLDLEVEIETGVMHQIRCSLAAIGHPILGDRIYRGRESSRLWLHAWKLLLPLKNGAELCLNAELPQGWP